LVFFGFVYVHGGGCGGGARLLLIQV